VPDEADLEPTPEEAVLRSFWSGTITFGLVSIPVALYAANRPAGVSLHMVSPEGTQLVRRYFTSRDDRELDADDIVRGYEYEKGKYVVVDDEELERLAPERTRDIDVRQFVKTSEIDPMYFERAYYLVPSGGSNKGYRLLARVMEESERAGIATFVMRGKEYLVAIVAENGILRAETLRFADELRSPADVGLPAPAKPPPAQVKRMEAAIRKREKKSLDRKELADTGTARLLALAKRKLKSGRDVVHVDAEENGDEPSERPQVIDLMEILKQRMAEAQEDAGEDSGGGARKSGPRKPAASKTKGRKGGGDDVAGESKAELYERAKKLDIPGRSQMSRDELAAAIRRSA
jgi:DNA end-binding protein Ku